MLRFTTGDMFETPADIRVNTVNCVGVMGAGVALAFKTRYPDMFRDYKHACEAGEVQPGKLHVWKSLTGDWIINFPTKRHWRENSRYEDIAAGLVALRNYLSTQGKVTVALPALGCGHGGLDWTRVSRMIGEHLNGLDAEIVVFEPADSRAAGEKALAEMLEAHGIRTVPLAAPGSRDGPRVPLANWRMSAATRNCCNNPVWHSPPRLYRRIGSERRQPPAWLLWQGKEWFFR